MKFDSDLACEHASLWFFRVVLLVLCGGFLTSFIIIAGGGYFAVYVMNLPMGSLRADIAVILYGMTALFLFHAITGCWFIREAITEWVDQGNQHRDEVAKLKNSPFARARG